MLQRLALFVIRRRVPVLLLLLTLAVAGAVSATQLSVNTESTTLIDADSQLLKASQQLQQSFGDEPAVVLVDQPLTDLLLTEDLGRMLGLEGCLAGRFPEGTTPPGGKSGPCAKLAEKASVEVVYGPATFINQSADQITRRLQQVDLQIKRAKSDAEAERLRQQYLQLGLRYGISGAPSIDDPAFISQLVFESSRGVGVPKARFGFLLPSKNLAQIQVRFKAKLTQQQREQSIALIREVLRMPSWKLAGGGSYSLTGIPVIVDEASSAMITELRTLLLFVVAAIALVLMLLFRQRARLLPLLLALVAVAVLFGSMAALGIELTVAGIASLPILIGLIVDYGMQLQSRLGGALLPESEGNSQQRRLIAATTTAAPAVCCAALVTAGSFLALLASPIPLVRGFSVVLILGVFIGLAVVSVGSIAAFSLLGERPAKARTTKRKLGKARFEGRSEPYLGWLQRHLKPVLAVAVLLAAVGWVMDGRSDVQSDPRKLLASDQPALKALDRLDQEGAASGELTVLVRAKDVSSATVVSWMVSYQQQMLKRFSYREESGCGGAQLCPGIGLAQLFGGGLGSGSRLLIENLPDYLTGAVISEDRKSAVISFGLPAGSLKRQQQVIQQLEQSLAPPAGVSAQITGFTAVAATANQRAGDPSLRLLTALVAALLAALTLLVIYRSLIWALLPVVPTVLATGWVGLVVAALGIPLNPLSATLGALVLAIACEFSVLITVRYRRELLAGADHNSALQRSYGQTSSVAVVSVLAATVGFAVLMLSQIPLLREFGLVVVVDLLIAAFGSLTLLPALLGFANQRGWLGSPDSG